MHNSNLSEMPDGLSELKNLTYLDIGDCNMKGIEDIENISFSLRTLFENITFFESGNVNVEYLLSDRTQNY